MKTLSIPATIALVLAAGACRERPEPRPEPREGAALQTISYAGGAGSHGRVTRARTPEGGEVLRGETVITLGASAQRCVVEDVTLDASGHLTHAEIALADGCGAAPMERIVLDPSRGEVRTTSAGTTSATRVPADAPWVYAPPAAVATPVSAWVTARAADARAVREIGATGSAPLVPRDQLAVETERGLTVIVGNVGADVDAAFVEEVRLADYGITLLRVPSCSAGAS